MASGGGHARRSGDADASPGAAATGARRPQPPHWRGERPGARTAAQHLAAAATGARGEACRSGATAERSATTSGGDSAPPPARARLGGVPLHGGATPGRSVPRRRLGTDPAGDIGARPPPQRCAGDGAERLAGGDLRVRVERRREDGVSRVAPQPLAHQHHRTAAGGVSAGAAGAAGAGAAPGRARFPLRLLRGAGEFQARRGRCRTAAPHCRG
eukprot:ctg_2535.g448